MTKKKYYGLYLPAELVDIMKRHRRRGETISDVLRRWIAIHDAVEYIVEEARKQSK